MVHTELLHEDKLREEHRLNINGKKIELIVKKEDGQAIFEFKDGSAELAPHEQNYLMSEMEAISTDFLSRRIFGTFVPREKKVSNNVKKVSKKFFRS
jgi:hypothetical protein